MAAGSVPSLVTEGTSSRSDCKAESQWPPSQNGILAPGWRVVSGGEKTLHEEELRCSSVAAPYPASSITCTIGSEQEGLGSSVMVKKSF